RLVLFAQDETRSFVNVSHQWGADIVNPTGTVLGDFNRDGKLDILTAQTNIRNATMKNRLYLLENDLSTSGRSVRFYLEGKVANAQGLGSMLMLYSQSASKKNIQRRWYELSQGGTPSQLPKGVHFGVEASSEVLGVKVRWPTLGAKDLLNSKPIERLYKIKDNKSKNYQEFTLCEDGKILEGRFSCL
ncbi:MAG: VCBS repeat-containing protein, partial [Proteobacteria bacterium]|nr:VCBS repeat-containing protein [Pseudomonadota bacterium]